MKFCSIASGSSGNCIFAGSGSSAVLVDAGISGKKIELGLNGIDMTTREVSALLLTHEHADHVKGVGVLARRYGLPIYTTEGTAGAILENTSLGKIPEGLIHTVKADQPFQIGDLTIRPFAISHDAAEPVGFRIEDGSHSAAVATDMGEYDEELVRRLKDLDILLLEANHDVRMLEAGPYPYYLKLRILGEKGHLSNETSGQLLCRLLHDNMKHIFLGHLSHENNYEKLAYETVCAEINMNRVPYKASDFHIEIAHRDVPSQAVEI